MTDIPETRFARTREGSIAYQVIGGDGDEAIKVIVSHAIFPIDLMWEEPHLVTFLNRLSSFSRHVWLDFYGTGASDWLAPTDRRVVESNISAMVAVLDDLEWERAAVLGLTAREGLLLAATHPERTRALVLVNNYPSIRRADDFPEGLADDVIERLRSVLERYPSQGTDAAFVAPSLAGEERFVRWLGRALRLAFKPADLPWVISHNLNLDLRHVLPAVRVPTLVVARQGLPAYLQGRYLAEHIEGARRVELPGEDILFFAGETLSMLDAIEEFLTGRLPAPDTNRVLATVVFTDLVESTERVAALGDRRWREVLTDHDRLVRQELERFRGHEVKATGDGFLATFDGPARAVRCACAVRDAVHALGIDLRIGVHTGEIELRGDDVSGIAVHVAERVRAAAQPGQVLVSETVPRLVVGSEIEFEDRGDHKLKGVPGTWRLFSVEG
jgi:class 3 adenylate cyclase